MVINLPGTVWIIKEKMDITVLFKACVKTIRTRNKALGMFSHGSGEVLRSQILNTNSPKTKFTHKAKEMLNQITRLRDFLLEHRKAYLNFGSHLSDLPRMNDSERDKIDSGAQIIIKQCSHLILEFKRECAVQDGSAQLIEHQDAVLDLIDSYLKTVCKIYSEQKAVVMKKVLETQKMSKLETEVINNNNKVLKKGPSLHNSEERDKSVENSANSMDIPLIEAENALLQDDQLSPEELQMFESENEQLYNELNSLTDEVRQIESKVVHIAELQEIFTEKVLEQEKDVERIISTVIGTTENLKDANTQIRQAIQSNAGLRVYVLFFLLVMSFSLLFLDWYND